MSELPKILLDCDVIRHFHRGCQLPVLPALYPDRLIILDKVKDELTSTVSLRNMVNSFISNYSIEEVNFPSDQDTIQEYARLINMLKGSGEAACMAYAKNNPNHCIASSNIKDIIAYCNQNGINYATTMDILVAANRSQPRILEVEDCNNFITKVLASGSKLPVTRLQDYVQGGYQIQEI